MPKKRQKSTPQPVLPSRPDLIFIITDQERTIQHFPADWEKNNLPTMMLLKQNGFSFDNATCNTCMCSPSRSTVFTGTYPAQHRVTETLTNGGVYSPGEIQLNNQTPNIGRILSDAGYDVQYRGKWHMSKGSDGGDPLAKDIALFGFKGWVGPDAGEDAKPENFGGGYANHDAMYIDQAIQYLNEVKARRLNGDNTPYCLVLSLVNPHDVLAYPNNIQYGYDESTYTGREIELPSTWNEDLIENQKPIAQFQTNLAADGLLGALPTPEMKLNYINFYAYLLKKIDKEIGTFIKELYRPDENGNALSNDAIVVRLADHGEMGMAHGGMRQKAFVAYEEAIRVPLVISNPIKFPPTAPIKSSNELATLIDVVPTLCEFLKVTSPSDCRGTSLSPLLSGGSVQDEVLFTFDDTKSGSGTLPSSVRTCNRIRAIRTKEWKYTYYFDALNSYETQYELYNLKDDPDEANNLAYKPEYQPRRALMHQQLQELMMKKLRVNAGAITSKIKKWVDTNPNYQECAYMHTPKLSASK
jgi:arylsulfatase A-like enzyme